MNQKNDPKLDKHMKDLRLNIAGRLKAYRIGGGRKSQTEFARILGLEPPTYRRYERGEIDIPYFVLLRLYGLAKLSLNYLIAGDTNQIKARSRLATQKIEN